MAQRDFFGLIYGVNDFCKAVDYRYLTKSKVVSDQLPISGINLVVPCMAAINPISHRIKETMPMMLAIRPKPIKPSNLIIRPVTNTRDNTPNDWRK